MGIDIVYDCAGWAFGFEPKQVFRPPQGLEPFSIDFTACTNTDPAVVVKAFDFEAFEREIAELQEDFDLLDAAGGDFNIAFGSPEPDVLTNDMAKLIDGPSKKILSSRTPRYEYLIEKRAENDLRRRNEGKKILSSRG